MTMTATPLRDLTSYTPPPRPRRGTPCIAIDDTPVSIRGEELSEVWWRGRQWAVTSDGLESLDGRYVIESERLRQGIGEPGGGWPAHMAIKRWADPDEFTTAWMIALILHGHAASLSYSELLPIFRALPPAKPI